MNYDKNSFLSGVAVGRQLKGWSTGPGQHTISGIHAVMGCVWHQRKVIPAITVAGTLTPVDNLLTPVVLIEAEGGGSQVIRIGTVAGSIAPESGIISMTESISAATHSHTTGADSMSGTLAPQNGIIGITASGVLVKDEE